VLGPDEKYLITSLFYTNKLGYYLSQRLVHTSLHGGGLGPPISTIK